LAVIGATGLAAVLRLWPAVDPEFLAHGHPDLHPDHPHLAGQGPHPHALVMDDVHRRWPKAA